MKAFLYKHATWILVVVILSVALVVHLANIWMRDHTGEVIVYVNGQETGTYSLYDKQEIRIDTPDGYNVLTIDGQNAYVSEADCENQVCVHTKPIADSGRQIVCLPHKVVIQMKNSEKSEIDAVTN